MCDQHGGEGRKEMRASQKAPAFFKWPLDRPRPRGAFSVKLNPTLSYCHRIALFWAPALGVSSLPALAILYRVIFLQLFSVFLMARALVVGFPLSLSAYLFIYDDEGAATVSAWRMEFSVGTTHVILIKE